MVRRIKSYLVHYKIQILFLIPFSLFLTQSLWHIELPGLQYDECLGAAPAVAFLNGSKTPPMQIEPSIIHIFGRPLPVMIMPYIGCIKTILHITVYSIFGISVLTTRLLPVILVCLSLLFWYLILLRKTSKQSATLAVSLMSIHPVFVFYLTRDVAPAAFAVLCQTVVLYFIFSDNKYRYLYAAFFAGLGVSHKVDFLWNIVACFAAFWIIYRPKLDLRKTVLAGSLFCLGALPIILFNLATLGLTGKISVSSFEISNVFASLITRTIQTFELASGGFILNYLTGIHLNAGIYRLIAGGMIALIFSSIKLPFTRFIALWSVFLLVFTSTSQFALHIHHTIILVPLIVVLVCLELTTVKKLGISIVAASFIFSSIKINYELQKTGGTGAWSDTTYLIAEDLKSHKGINLMNWGFTNNLIVLSKGQLEMKRYYSDRSFDSTFTTLTKDSLDGVQYFERSGKLFATIKKPPK